MSTQVLRPNGTVSAGTATATGAASLHAALSDNSDSSYIVGNAAYLSLDDFALPSGARVLKAVLRTRVGGYAGDNILVGAFDDGSRPNGFASGPDMDALYSAVLTLPSTTTITVGQVAGRGDYWTDANIDTWKVVVGSPDWRIYEAYVDVVYVTVPVVTVASPSGTFTDRNLPTVGWNVAADADGGAQTKYEVKIFSAAQYGAGGFNPDTSTPTTQSGILNGTSLGWTPGALLANATYRAYVRSAQTLSDGTTYWSAWAYSGFVINVTAPSAPSVTATVDDTHGRVTVDLDDASGTSTDLFELQRTLDAGTTWTPVRVLAPSLGAHPTPPGDGGIVVPAAGLATVYDYEVPLGTTVQYRARALHDYGGYAASSWATSASVVSTSTQWWLKDPTNPTLNVAISLDGLPQVDQAARQGILQPIGSSVAIAISDTRGARRGTVRLQLRTLAERAAVDALLSPGRVLFLDGPASNYWPGRYIAAGDLSSVRAIDKAFIGDTVDSIAWTEVAAPTDPVTAW